MKLIFNNIILHNFLSFGHAEIDLKDKGYTLISGVNHNPNDAAKSNGSGKSTIFSGLCYALTGETIQGLSSNLNNMFTDGDMYVTLDFTVNKDHYVITRSRTQSGKSDLKVIINDEDKSGKGIRESEQVLEEHIPDLSSELVGEVIIIGQGMPHKFSNNSPSGRKDLLEKLSHSDYMLEDIRTRIESRVATLRESQDSLTTKKVEAETKQTIANQTLTNAQNELNELNNKSNLDFDALIAKCDKDIFEFSEKLETATKDKELIDEKLKSCIDKQNNLLKEKSEKIREETEVFNQHNLSVKTAIAEHTAQITNLTAEINKLKDVKDVCPLCGQKLPHVHKTDTTKQEEEKAKLEEELKELKEKDQKQEEAFRLNKQDINEHFTEAEGVCNSELEQTKIAQQSQESILRNLTSQINAFKIAKIGYEKDKEQVEKDRARLASLISTTQNSLDDLSQEILYIIKDMEKITEHQAVISKMSTLVKRDFRGILLTNIINYLDNKCKEYCKEIFGTTELSFKLDGNNISITYLGKPLEALSGGEQQKVDLILQFAIRCMMQEYTGFTSNILVLDEILDNLDSTGCDQILNFITNRLSDIESIFIISHHADSLNIGNDSEIIVVKDSQGVSYIQ